MTQSTTQAKPSTEHKGESCSTEQVKHQGGSCSTDKAAKTAAEKSSCSTEHKQGSCSSKP